MYCQQFNHLMSFNSVYKIPDHIELGRDWRQGNIDDTKSPLMSLQNMLRDKPLERLLCMCEGGWEHLELDNSLHCWFPCGVYVKDAVSGGLGSSSSNVEEGGVLDNKTELLDSEKSHIKRIGEVNDNYMADTNALPLLQLPSLSVSEKMKLNESKLVGGGIDNFHNGSRISDIDIVDLDADVAKLASIMQQHSSQSTKDHTSDDNVVNHNGDHMNGSFISITTGSETTLPSASGVETTHSSTMTTPSHSRANSFTKRQSFSHLQEEYAANHLVNFHLEPLPDTAEQKLEKINSKSKIQYRKVSGYYCNHLDKLCHAIFKMTFLMLLFICATYLHFNQLQS